MDGTDAIHVVGTSMRARTATFISALALAFAATSTATALADTRCANTDVLPGTVDAAVVQQATLCLLNEQRAAAGEVALVQQPQLDAASLDYSNLMVAQQFFAHVSPAGTTLESRVATSAYTSGYATWSLGENLAWGSGSLATPAAIVGAWMNSPGHRENILQAKFREIGLGIVTGGPVATTSAGATYTTDFGVRGDYTAAAASAAGTRATPAVATVAAGSTNKNVAAVDKVGGTPSAAARKAIVKKHKTKAAKKAKKAHKARAKG